MYKSEVTGKGNISAKVVCDSIANNIRIVTMELMYPRFIHAEFLTHRQFSRNASSSRAIPVAKMIEQVDNNPAMPIHWGKNQAGMQSYEEHVDASNGVAEYLWEVASIKAKHSALKMMEKGYHKQIVNRLLEPFQFIKTVVTATEWDNFFALRNHHAAQPEIQELARVMKQAQDSATPTELNQGEWHLPYIEDVYESREYMWLDLRYKGTIEEGLRKISAARCARISYLNHDKSQPDVKKDLELYDMLATRPYDNGTLKLGADEPVHLSPLEHQATPMRHPKLDTSIPWEKGTTHFDFNRDVWSGNFRGWIQHRQLL